MTKKKYAKNPKKASMKSVRSNQQNLPFRKQRLHDLEQKASRGESLFSPLDRKREFGA